MCEDESSAFTGSKDRSIIRWDVATGKKVAFLGRGRNRGRGKASTHAQDDEDGHSDAVLAVDVSTDGRHLASAGCDRYDL